MVMDRAEVKLFGKWTLGSRRIWIRGRIYMSLGNIAFSRRGSRGRGTKFGDFIFFGVDFTKGEWR